MRTQQTAQSKLWIPSMNPFHLCIQGNTQRTKTPDVAKLCPTRLSGPQQQKPGTPRTGAEAKTPVSSRVQQNVWRILLPRPQGVKTVSRGAPKAINNRCNPSMELTDLNARRERGRLHRLLFSFRVSFFGYFRFPFMSLHVCSHLPLLSLSLSARSRFLLCFRVN